MRKYNRDSLPENEEELKEEKTGFTASFFKYLHYWKWFMFTIVISLSLAVLYLIKTNPTYQIKAKILLKDDQDSENTVDNLNTFQNGIFNVKNNAENELEVLNTSYLVEQTIRKLGIYAQYYRLGSFNTPELYGADCPVSVRLPEELLNKIREKIDFEVEVRTNGTYVLTGKYMENDFRVLASREDSIVELPFGLIYLKPGILNPAETMRIGVTLKSPSKMAANFMDKMDVSLTSKTTTAVNLTLKTSNLRRGSDFINTFIETYNEEDLKSKNMLANNTSVFLDTLLNKLGNEVNDIEKRVETYKQSQGLTDITSNAQLLVQRTGDYEQKRLEVETQLGIIKDLDSYINKKENRYQLLPSGTGLASASLNMLIGEYNNLLLDRKRLSRTATENNQVMIDLTDRIEALFRTVQSSVGNEKRSLMISQQDLARKNSENVARIRSIPRQEREFSDISRQQNIKSQLYLFLLQKKEENYMSMTTVTPKAKIIDYPHSNGEPVSPKIGVVIIMALISGFFIPVLGISVRDLLHYTVENKEELKEISSIPILGEIPKNEHPGNMLIHEHATDGFTEMFRLLRTNLLFILNEPGKKVINIVSSINSEGKTFITINLATSLAFLDKKVLIVGLDVRKPKVGEYLGLDEKTGVTLYLSGHLDRSELIRPSGIHSNLWVITSGPVPPNPNELLAKSALDELIAACREQFDYIFVDTAPVGAVSDSLLLNRFADVNLYVVRADYTPKKDILDANELYIHKKLKNMYIVFNSADMRKAAGYRYGYNTRKYGHGYGYGYGYYGQDKEGHHKKDTKSKS